MSLVTKSAEEFARRAYDLNLLTQRQLESVWSELGTRSVSAADLQRVLATEVAIRTGPTIRLTSWREATEPASFTATIRSFTWSARGRLRGSTGRSLARERETRSSH